MATKKYRQITRRLRLQYGPGKPDIESERPSRQNNEGRRVYTDSDENPTLVMFTGEEVGLDLDQLLASGAIVEYHPTHKPAAKQGGDDGKSSGS